MTKKIAINGFGRIGKMVFKEIVENEENELEVVAINDLTEIKTLAHLLKYDSVYGQWDAITKVTESSIFISNQAGYDCGCEEKPSEREIKIFAEKDPKKLPWGELEIDLVLECTGIFRDKKGAGKHLTAGAKKVIISAPPKDSDIPLFVPGVNEEDYNGEKILSMASCTTNCLAPIVSVLNKNFGIEKGFITTIHSYTNDQNILDLPHSDLRRARAAGINMIPTTTGAAKSIGKIIPELEGKLDGISIRVPTPTVSILDLVCLLKKKVNKEELIKVFKEYSENELNGILNIEKEPLVSSDYIGNPYSAIIDEKTIDANEKLVKIIAWYDNEYGYSCRLAEFVEYILRE